jgi:hypothetical protein
METPLLVAELSRLSRLGYFSQVVVEESQIFLMKGQYGNTCNIPLKGDAYTRSTMLAFAFFNIYWPRCVPDLKQLVNQEVVSRNRGFSNVFDHHKLVEFVNSTSVHYVVFYDNKMVELLDLDPILPDTKKFQIACYRVRDNSRYGYVRTSKGQFYLITHTSKIAKKITIADILNSPQVGKSSL